MTSPARRGQDTYVARERSRNLNPDVIARRRDAAHGRHRLPRQPDAAAADAGGDGLALTERGARVTLAALSSARSTSSPSPRSASPTAEARPAGETSSTGRTAAKAPCDRLVPGGRAPAGRQRRRHAAAARRPACAIDREDHLHRRLHRRHRGDPRGVAGCRRMHAGVTITQHMPPGFTGPLRGALDAARAASACRGADGAAHAAGPRHVAPGGLPWWWSARRQLHRPVRDGEPVNRPSSLRSSVLFESACPSWSAQCARRDAHRHGRRRLASDEGHARCRQLQLLPGTSRAAWSSACPARLSGRAAHEVLLLEQDRPGADRAAASTVAPAAPRGALPPRHGANGLF